MWNDALQGHKGGCLGDIDLNCPRLTDCWASRRSTPPRASLWLGATSASARSGAARRARVPVRRGCGRSRVGEARRPGLDRAPSGRRLERQRRGHHGPRPAEGRAGHRPGARRPGNGGPPRMQPGRGRRRRPVPGADPAVPDAAGPARRARRGPCAPGRLSRRDGTRARRRRGACRATPLASAALAAGRAARGDGRDRDRRRLRASARGQRPARLLHPRRGLHG